MFSTERAQKPACPPPHPLPIPPNCDLQSLQHPTQFSKWRLMNYKANLCAGEHGIRTLQSVDSVGARRRQETLITAVASWNFIRVKDEDYCLIASDVL